MYNKHYESLLNRVKYLESLVYEGKQVGTLYHVCSLPSFIFNIEHNKIEADKYANVLTFVDGSLVHTVDNGRNVYYYIGNDKDKVNWKSDEYQDKIIDLINKKGVEKHFVSFTRNQKYKVSPGNSKFARFIRIVLDGDLISENNKVMPFDFYNGDYPNWNNTAQSNGMRAGLFESEELVESPLNNLTKYIIRIEIDKSVEYADEAKKYFGITPQRLNKFIKLCMKNNLIVDNESKQHLINAYKNLCLSDNIEVSDKIISDINNL